MGSQGEERESKPFSLDISSGKVCYCAKPCSESGKLFQFCIFLFFFLLPVITAQMASSSGQGHAPKFSQMGPQGCSGPLQYNRTICMLFKQLQAHIPGTRKHTQRRKCWLNQFLYRFSKCSHVNTVIIHALL